MAGNSCSCIRGYTWNSALKKCVCDYTQNFWVISGVCYDCTSVPNTNGIASSSGCQCGNQLTWIASSNKCDCPVGYVNMGSYCISCSAATLPAGATVAGCQACNVSQGFFLSGGICYACSAQKYTNGSATATGCSCKNSSLVWVTSLRSCACSFSSGFTSTIVAGSLSCVACSGSSCSCGYPGTGTIYSNNICINCVGVPNSNGVALNRACVCLTGYKFTAATYPNECYCSYQLGYYIGSGSSCLSCAALPSTGSVTSSGCQICSYLQGFLYLSNDTCIQCSAIPGSSGSANNAGCICTSGQWNSVLSQCVNVVCSTGYIYSSQNMQCICNPTVSINSATNCTPCSSITNSNGIPTNSTACGCNTGYVWTVSGSLGACTSIVTNCNTTTSVIIGSICYNCLTAQFSTGPAVGTAKCLCPSALVWSFNTVNNTGACICSNSLQIPSTNGTSCICNSAYAIPSTSTPCLDCRTVNYSTNTTVAGGCGCLTNFAWNSTSLSCVCSSPFIVNGSQCVCNPSTAVILNAVCSLCSNDAKSTGVSTGTACVCQTYFIWNGTACINQCNSTAVVITLSASASSCLNCGNSATFTLAKINTTACSCTNSALSWNNLGYCDCGASSAMIVTGTNYVCVLCNSAIYSTGANNSYSCSCPSPLTWNPTTKACDCGPSAVVAYINSVYSCVVCNN